MAAKLPEVDTKIKHLPRGQLVSATIAASMMGFTEQFLQRRCQVNKCPIPHWRIDGNYKFDTADIEDYLDTVYVPAGNNLVVSEA